MKKLFTIILLMMFYIGSVALTSFAMDYRSWQNPTKIKTYIPSNSKRTISMRHACAEWSRLTQNRIVFVYVTNPNVANLIVKFVPVIPEAADREIGLTKARFTPDGKMVKAEVLIADKAPDGRVLGKDAVYTVMLHELGHAIGIGKHSENPLSIMFPAEDDRQEILKSDIKTLADIYGWK